MALLEMPTSPCRWSRTSSPTPRNAPRGEEVIRSVKPADQVVKIVYDGLVEMLGGDEPEPLNLNANPPVVVLMAGLQGSGKTTTAGKLALRLQRHERKKVMLASLDTRRPAAMEQLKMLARTGRGGDSRPSSPARARSTSQRLRAASAAKLAGYDVP